MDNQKSESLSDQKIILIVSTLGVTSLKIYTGHSKTTKHRNVMKKFIISIMKKKIKISLQQNPFHMCHVLPLIFP